MSETQVGVSGRPATRKSPFLIAVTALAILFGIVALALAGWGWTIELPARPNPPAETHMLWVDVVVRAVKVLLLSDIYYEDLSAANARLPLEWARAFGVASSLLFGVRLLLYAIGSHIHALWFRATSGGHDVIVGDGPAAVEYAGDHGRLFAKRRAIHLAAERAPTTRRLATFARGGSLENQLRASAAFRAKRIVVDEGDDADTWQTAQAIARKCGKTEILAHISDPWMRDRLSREVPTAKLTPFSYAAGAARQAMLAHPPYLIAGKLGAPAQHILIVGFGQVGQSVAREFIVTCVSPQLSRMMVTVVDPQATRIETDFRSRHPDLCTPKDGSPPASDANVDFGFFEGDFRLQDDKLFDFIRKRSQASEVCAVYIAIDLERRPLGLALALRAMATQEKLFRAPIFVCAQHGAGLPAIRQGAGYVAGDITKPDELIAREREAAQDGRLFNLSVVSFGSWPDAFDGAGLIERDHDGQAQRFHKEYSRLAADVAREKNPQLPPPEITKWAALSDQLRISNRRVAAHIRAKAHAAGFDLHGWLDQQRGGWQTHDLPPAADGFKLDDRDFMLRMAKLEHQRWMLDRYLDGWKLGPRDDYARMRPDLIPFEKLALESVHKDDEVIKTTKALLADANPGRKRR